MISRSRKRLRDRKRLLGYAAPGGYGAARHSSRPARSARDRCSSTSIPITRCGHAENAHEATWHVPIMSTTATRSTSCGTCLDAASTAPSGTSPVVALSRNGKSKNDPLAGQRHLPASTAWDPEGLAIQPIPVARAYSPLGGEG